MEKEYDIGLNPLHSSTVVIAQLLRTLLDHLLVKGSILLRFFVFKAKYGKFFNISKFDAIYSYMIYGIQ